MPRLEAEAANLHSPTFQQPDLPADQKAEKNSDNQKASSESLRVESSSALSNVAEFRALQDKNVFKKTGETQITSLAPPRQRALLTSKKLPKIQNQNLQT